MNKFHITTALLAVLTLATAVLGAEEAGFCLLNVDFQKLISRADIVYTKPATRSEAGLPIGNGNTGTLVWTTPTSLRMQINRVDVFSCNSTTNSFNRHEDYCTGCGYVDIDLAGFGDEVFGAGDTRQHLSLYDGTLQVDGKGVSMRMFTHVDSDVIAIKVNDTRTQPDAISIDLRMLRYQSLYIGGSNYALTQENASVVRTKNHRAVSKIDVRDEYIILTQEFSEKDYLCKSAVAIAVKGAAVKAELANESTARLMIEPGSRNFTVLIGSAATFAKDEDVAQKAISNVTAAKKKTFKNLLERQQQWWHDFWEKSFVCASSADGKARTVEEHYTYFLYLMGSTSRGKFPPKYNGMLWNTTGDARMWGTQYWWNNLSLYYRPLPAANHLELMDPLFDMYSGMYDSCARAARQQWASKGIFISETTFFDGFAELPEDIAKEMQQLYLLKKPWSEKSQRFTDYAFTQHPHNSRWNWKDVGSWRDGQWRFPERPTSPVGFVVHIFGSMGRVAYQYWLQYEYSQDVDWLSERAYPMLKGVTEFFRNYPNTKKEADGRYHIYYINNREGLWGGKDAIGTVAAIRGTGAAAIRASEILDVDESLRAEWREFVDNAPLLARSDHPDAIIASNAGEPVFWVEGLKPAVRERGGRDISPVKYFDLCTLETAESEPDVFRTGQTTFDMSFAGGLSEDQKVAVMSEVGHVAARLGKAEAVRVLLVNQIINPHNDYCDFKGSGGELLLANRMTLREGPGALGAQRLGNAAYTLQEALCQSVPAGPGQEPVIRVFPAWPKTWDGGFKLLCRKGFLVSSTMKNGKVPFVEIESQLGRSCAIRNPWQDGAVTLYRNGKKSENLKGKLLRFDTQKNERITIAPKGIVPKKLNLISLLQ